MPKIVYPIVTIVFIIASFGILWNYQSAKEEPVLSEMTQRPTPTPLYVPHGKMIKVVIGNTPFNVFAFQIEATASVKLIPNFNKREFPSDLARKNQCDFAINGGFYLGDYSPLGLFYTEGKLIGKHVQGTIANSYFYQNKLGQRIISKQWNNPLKSLDFILQTGPLYKVETKRTSLSAGHKARRSILGTDEKNNLYMFSITSGESHYSGPNLPDVPLILSQTEIQKVASVSAILNLDGGGASFLYSKDAVGEFLLPNLTPVGSVICVKKNIPNVITPTIKDAIKNSSESGEILN